MKRFFNSLSLIVVVILSSVYVQAGQYQKPTYKIKKIIRGADFHGPASVNFNPAGDMFVVDFFTGKILKTDPDTGKVLRSYNKFVETADIDFAQDGTMFWANPFSGQVYKKEKYRKPQLIGQINTVIDGIAVNDEGRVFTASFIRGQDGLWEVDPEGIKPPRLVVALGGFDAFDFGPDGYLYAPDYLYGTGQIYKIDIDTGEYEVIARGFCQPIATKFNSLGELHVMDALCPQIDKVDIETGERTLVATLEAGCDNFDFNVKDELFFANNANAYIGKVGPNGTVEYVTTPGLSAPGGISIRPDGSLFVADGFAMRRYDIESQELKKTYYANAGMIPPFSLFDDGKHLITTNNLFSYVQVWDPDADKPIATYTNFKQPQNAIRFKDDIVVAELGTGSVVTVGDHTPLITGLIAPAGLASLGDDLYVSDRATGKIWKAVEYGIPLEHPVVVVDSLSSPEGIAFDNDGNLLVVDVGSRRLISVDLDTGKKSVIAKRLNVGLKPLSGTPPSWAALSSIAVATSGALYVTGDKGNVVYKITKKSKRPR